MKKKNLVKRRTVVVAGLTSLAGFLLYKSLKTSKAPTYGNILRMGDEFTYEAQRALLPGQSLVKEYTHNDISSFPATGSTNPGDASMPYFSKEYASLQKNGFADWRLSIEGLVVKPGTYSLADLQKFPSRTQITRHTCEEGWTAIAEWTGVQLSRVLQDAGIRPGARFINFYAYDGDWDSIDMLDAFHPQTILAYGMNAGELPTQHGAPLRVRVETQIGYKSVKYLQRIVVTDKFVDPPYGGEWAWYTGI
jgi:DMSO/TMAO reductase YedYZ molybdopterin-dependent catalytic subunit